MLQLIQFLDNPLFHHIQNKVKLTFSLQSHTTTTTALLTQVSIRATCFCQQKPFSSILNKNDNIQLSIHMEQISHN